MEAQCVLCEVLFLGTAVQIPGRYLKLSHSRPPPHPNIVLLINVALFRRCVVCAADIVPNKS